MGGASGAEGALGAEWIFRKADESAKFHESLVMETGMELGDEGGGEGM